MQYNYSMKQGQGARERLYNALYRRRYFKVVWEWNHLLYKNCLYVDIRTGDFYYRAGNLSYRPLDCDIKRFLGYKLSDS